MRCCGFQGGVLLMLAGWSYQAAYAQRSWQTLVETGTYVPFSGQTTFWLRANEYGIVPFQQPAATLRLGTTLDYDSLRLFTHRLTTGGGIRVAGNAGNAGKGGSWLLPEAYVKARLGIVEAYVGRRQEMLGLADSTLSTGSYAWSGNALPVPKIQLEIRSFTPIGLTNGFVSVKGSFAHGWLGGRFVQHTLLHQKSLYVRLGKPKSRLKAYGGLNHQVMWGGNSDELVTIGMTLSSRLPSTFHDYLSVVSGLRSVTSGIIDPTIYTDFDLTNRVGNHLGSVDMALELTTSRFTFYAYRQNPYETGALFYGTSLADGLNGFRIRSNDPHTFVQQLLFEYLNTTSQGGAEFIISDPQRRGRVDYFNHAQFRNGWSYQGMGLGTPFITPVLSSTGDLPYGTFTLNNRVQVWHLGIAGNLTKSVPEWLAGPVTYQSKFSFSRNVGTYAFSFSGAGLPVFGYRQRPDALIRAGRSQPDGLA